MFLPRYPRHWLSLIFCLLLLVGTVQAHDTAPDLSGESVTDVRQLWQLLDYIAVDYNGAVADGAVIDQGEYDEMLEFARTSVRQIQSLPGHAAKADITAAASELEESIIRKASGEQVAELAHRANALIVSAYPFPMAPSAAPDLTVAAGLYAIQCASCHGAAGGGDGPLAPGMDPEPIAFTDDVRAQSRSVTALYQVITQGVQGTAMPGFTALSDDERWALAFFVGSMAYDDSMRERGHALWKDDSAVRAYFQDITALVTQTQLRATETLPADQARDAMAYLRSEPQAIQAGQPIGLTLARTQLDASLAALRAGDRSNATRLALSAYLDGFEPIEPKLGARNKPLLTAVEDAMLLYRSAVSRDDLAQAETVAARLNELFSQVESELDAVASSPMTTFLGALTILLREGLEALLIVIGIVAFLKKADRPDALRHVHAGWASALVAGGMTWFAATYLITISGANREITEGLGSVLAALVLLSVGLWMHQKSSAGRWHDYLTRKVSAAMSRRSAWALFGLAFIAVYREVFETVLFYSALATDGNSGALLAGFLVACVFLAIIAWVLLRTSAHMPIGRFFSITSVLVAILAIVLVGKGIASLQEAGWVGATPIAAPRLDLLGMYPTAETMAAQLIILLVVVAGFGLNLLGAARHKKS